MEPPARHLLLRHSDSYGAAGLTNSLFAFHQQTHPSLIPPLMAEGGSGSSRRVGKEQEEEEDAGLDSTTASKEERRSYRAGWLQLGVGSFPASTNTDTAYASLGRGVSTELKLFPERPPLLPVPLAPAVAITSYGSVADLFRWRPESSSSPAEFHGDLRVVGRPQLLRALAAPAVASTSYGAVSDRSGWRPESSSSPAGLHGDMRVVVRPQRARAGFWVALRPAENQVNEPFLSELPKSFLRIKDGRTTIRLLMRYLANKLGLQDESEVEITCRRQLLTPFAMLDEVRDHIWYASEAPGPTAPAVEHVMKLRYSRRA